MADNMFPQGQDVFAAHSTKNGGGLINASCEDIRFFTSFRYNAHRSRGRRDKRRLHKQGSEEGASSRALSGAERYTTR